MGNFKVNIGIYLFISLFVLFLNTIFYTCETTSPIVKEILYKISIIDIALIILILLSFILTIIYKDSEKYLLK